MKSLNTFILFLIASIGWGQNANSSFEAGLNAYEGERYDEAILYFDQAPPSAATEFNLGNCYFQKGSYAKAVLHFEKARMSAPGDPDIIHNLNQANEQLPFKVKKVRVGMSQLWILRMIHHAPKGIWTLASILGSLLGTLLLAIYFLKIRKRMIFSAGVFILTLGIVSLYPAYKQAYPTINQDAAIVVKDDAFTKNVPSSTGIDELELRAGMKVTVLKRGNKTWLQVQLENGKTGWIEETVVEQL